MGALSDLDSARGALALPVVLKPRCSYRLAELSTKVPVRRAASWKQAAEIVGEPLRAGPVLVQERFPGVGVGVEVLADQGICFSHSSTCGFTGP